jgi:hypothetical protein
MAFQRHQGVARERPSTNASFAAGRSDALWSPYPLTFYRTGTGLGHGIDGGDGIQSPLTRLPWAELAAEYWHQDVLIPGPSKRSSVGQAVVSNGAVNTCTATVAPPT